MPPIADILKSLRQSEVFLALGVVGILAMLFVPLPAVLLDLFFALNITISVVILLTVLFIRKALEFSAFPMLLLVTTLFRLALNIASTRLILEYGHTGSDAAGKIIEAFGSVVMGGSFVIGLVIFLILTIINFVVITKGAGRIAEVAARFTLDSLPGKQMAIDAELNAGQLNEEQAKQRRKDLEQETGFFGAMDGASKFVRGDAIAGLIITAINIIVGISVGVFSHDMTMFESADRYVLLTVGDALVAYIPALTISVAAGILVSKGGTLESAGTVVFGQMGQSPNALFVASGLMLLIGMLPNMPILPFLIISGLMAAAGGAMMQAQTLKENEVLAVEAQKTATKQAEAAMAAAPNEDAIGNLLQVDTLRLELGYGLLTLIDETKGGRLTDQIRGLRRQMAKESGFVVPSVRIQDNMQLDAGGYVIFIKDIKAAEGILRPGKLLAMDYSGAATPLAGEQTKEPTFGLPALWIEPYQREEAQFAGYTVVDASTVVITHLTEVIKDNLSELLTRSELEKLIAEIKPNNEKLITDLIPEKVSLGLLQRVLQNLLAERISIRDLPTVIEALADSGGIRNVSVLTELVRARLGRQITAQNQGVDGVVQVVALSGAWEKEFAQSLMPDGDERQLAMAPDRVQTFLRTTRDVFERQMMAGGRPVLLTSPSVRPYVRSLIERVLPQVAVLSQAELYAKARIKTVGTV